MKITFDLKGLEDLQKNLEGLQCNLEKLAKERKVPYGELLPPVFMKEHTPFGSIEEMVSKSPFKVENEKDFKNIPDRDWDGYVREKTSFQGWGEMLSKAGEEYLGKQVQKIITDYKPK